MSSSYLLYLPTFRPSYNDLILGQCVCILLRLFGCGSKPALHCLRSSSFSQDSPSYTEPYWLTGRKTPSYLLTPHLVPFIYSQSKQLCLLFVTRERANDDRCMFDIIKTTRKGVWNTYFSLFRILFLFFLCVF